MSDAHASAQEHHHTNYVKIWLILVGLLVVSVVGPFVGSALHMQAITLITAFGIAVVKAFLVAKHFMHINIEKRFVAYLLVGMVALMALMFGGVAPDVMRHEGQRWENVAAKKAVERGMAEAPAEEHH